MFEFHGWFALRDATEDGGANVVREAVEELRGWLAERVAYVTVAVDVHELNGEYFLNLTGLANRRHGRPETDDLEDLLPWLVKRLPGSYGLLFERSDDMPTPPGAGAFRVRALRRGRVSEHLDPFLSPIQPNIED